MADDSKETVSRRILWAAIGSVVAIIVGAAYAWLSGILDPAAVRITVQPWSLFSQQSGPTYDRAGKSVVDAAEVKIKNIWSKSLKSVEVNVSVVPGDTNAKEIPSIYFDSKCQGTKSAQDFLGFFDLMMRCEFLHPNEEVRLRIEFSTNKISGLLVKYRSPEGGQRVEHSFDRD